MNFDHLTPTKFEELCFDLLRELGYTKLSWRKGTALSTSPSDQGRDIEGYFPHTEADGHVYEQRWFVECKHQKKGVPPDSLLPLLTWASAEVPDGVRIIASGFLSNATKTWLDSYTRKNIAFKIRLWEQKDLEHLLIDRTALLRKYELAPDLTFVDRLHPLHLKFIRKPPVNSLQFLLGIMDQLDPAEREAWFDGCGCYLCFIRPQLKTPESDDQVLGELVTKSVSYYEFKKEILKAANVVDDFFLVRAVVGQALTGAFRLGDVTAHDEILATHRSAISDFEERLARGEGNKAALEGCIRMSRNKIETLESDLAEGRQSYLRFCERVLAPLFFEEPPSHLLGEAE